MLDSFPLLKYALFFFKKFSIVQKSNTVIAGIQAFVWKFVEKLIWGKGIFSHYLLSNHN